MLAQRAASEGPRWTRAVEDQSAPIPEEVRASLDGSSENSFDDRNRGSTRIPLKVKWGLGQLVQKEKGTKGSATPVLLGVIDSVG